MVVREDEPELNDVLSGIKWCRLEMTAVKIWELSIYYKAVNYFLVMFFMLVLLLYVLFVVRSKQIAFVVTLTYNLMTKHSIYK